MPSKFSFAALPARFPCRAASRLAATAFLGLSACAYAPGMSVPSQPGKTISDAREAVLQCAPATAQTGFFGAGGRRALDNCLSTQGYSRRVLTAEEASFLRALYGYQRQIFLDHLVEGGTLAGFKQEYDVQ